MKQNKPVFITILAITALALAGCTHSAKKVTEENANTIAPPVEEPPRVADEALPIIDEPPPSPYKKETFVHLDNDYEFFVDIPRDWEVEYVAGIESINIYDPAVDAESVREKSQIFIRKFRANRFLTLGTVTILEQEKTNIKEHPAVRYEIKKKPGVANFAQQPLWRNEQHKLIDIRHAPTNPSEFYVFTYNPELAEDEFERFIDSLVFFSDVESIAEPIDDSKTRITKKPFGILIDPETSPVQPEVFRGYHTGTDFEVTSAELEKKLTVYTICGGVIRQSKRVSGFGGVIVQKCLFNDTPVNVIYGHVVLPEGIIGNYFAPGDELTTLGKNKSEETSGERKHLHISISKKTTVDLRGYVDTEATLESWFNFEELVTL